MSLQLPMHLVLNQRLELNQEPRAQTPLKLKFLQEPLLKKVLLPQKRQRPKRNQLMLVPRLHQQKKSKSESQSPKRA
jgi:hypothetical protein